MAEYVFIGGHADGMRLSINNGLDFFHVPYNDGTGRVGSYSRERLAAGKHVFEFFLAVGTDAHEALAMLLACYRPAKDAPRWEIATPLCGSNIHGDVVYAPVLVLKVGDHKIATMEPAAESLFPSQDRARIEGVRFAAFVGVEVQP